VSFNSSQSWNDIYGFRQGHQTFLKSDFYEGGPFAGRGVHSIVSERDVDAHAQMRRHLAHAFSDRSLSEQEALVAETVDKFVRVVGERGGRKGGFDISKGLEMMTFDIIGDLAFGEVFGGVESGECPSNQPRLEPPTRLLGSFREDSHASELRTSQPSGRNRADARSIGDNITLTNTR
jgi:cytochrome P450